LYCQVLALVWLFSKPIFYTLLPYAVYSTFHFLTYLRTNLLPALMPPPPAPAAASGQGAAPGDGTPRKGPQPPLAEAIARFVKQNYDASMHLVSRLELALWARVFFGTLIFSNSWILLVVYSVFVRVRYAQSQFMRSAVLYMERFFDGLLADQRVPGGVRNGWGAFKGVIRTVGDKTDFGKKTQ
jgi:transmembrane protein 33